MGTLFVTMASNISNGNALDGIFLTFESGYLPCYMLAATHEELTIGGDRFVKTMDRMGTREKSKPYDTWQQEGEGSFEKHPAVLDKVTWPLVSIPKSLQLSANLPSAS